MAPAAPAPTGSTTRLQHTAASLEVRVADTDKLSQATTAATRIATSLGGYAQSVVYRTPQAGGGTAFLELRIPAANVKQALARLAALGTLVSQQVSVQDLQHAFAVQSAQIAQLRRSIAALQQALQNPSLPDAQKVLLQIRLAEQKRALAQRLHARTGTVAAGTTSRVSLVLSTKQSVVPVAAHRGRIGRMVHSAVGFLALEATVALYALIVVSPFLLLAGTRVGAEPGAAAARRAASARCLTCRSDGIRPVVVGALSTGHAIGLGVVALIFVVFALLSSFVGPRWRPDFPGKSGLKHLRRHQLPALRGDARGGRVFGAEKTEKVGEAQAAVAAGKPVAVTENEFHVILASKTLPAGTYTFVVKNAGKIQHDLAVQGGAVNAKTPLINPGSTAKVTVKLPAGTYTLYCTVPGHKAAGMVAKLTVS